MTGTDFFAGFLTSASPDALAFFKEPEAPSNYKNPEAIREYKQRAREAFLEKAAFQAVTGGLIAFHIQDVKGKTVLELADTNPGVVSSRLVKWLVDNEFDEYPVTVSGTFTPSRRMWGFSLDQALRIAGLEALRYGRFNGLGELPPPLRIWYKNQGLYDPYEIVTGSSERKVLELSAVCGYLGIDVQARELDPDHNQQSHVSLARVARLLTLRCGLIPLTQE